MAGSDYRLTSIGELEGLAWLTPPVMVDARGWLSERYNREALAALGLPEFIHEIASWTRMGGVVRGLHFQTPPMGQAKLFRVVRGCVRLAALDLRASTFGAWATVDAGKDDPWIFVPEGLAQGFQAMCDDVEIVFKCSRPFSPDHLGQIAWDDPELPWTWPIDPPDSSRSARDALSRPIEAWRGLF